MGQKVLSKPSADSFAVGRRQRVQISQNLSKKCKSEKVNNKVKKKLPILNNL
jgi:hypothetical protein